MELAMYCWVPPEMPHSAREMQVIEEIIAATVNCTTDLHSLCHYCGLKSKWHHGNVLGFVSGSGTHTYASVL